MIDLITRFTEGDCHVLARRIHRITGWPIYAFCRKDEENPEANLHVFNKTPDGRFVDITGFHSEAEFMDEWNEGGYWDHKEFSLKETRDHWGRPEYGHWSYALARRAADELVKHGNIISRDNKIPNYALRSYVEASGMAISEISRKAGFVDKHGHASSSTVNRALGLAHYKKNGKSYLNENITIPNAIRICRAIGRSPIDIGL